MEATTSIPPPLANLDAKSRYLNQLLESIRQERTQHELTWQALFDLFNPWRGNPVTRLGNGQPQVDNVLDSTGIIACANLTNHVVTNICPQNVKWLIMEIDNAEELGLSPDEELAVNTALDAASIRALRGADQSNWYSELPTAVRDFLICGNAAMHVSQKGAKRQMDGSTYNGTCFEAIPPWRLWWRYDRQGYVQITIREWEISASEAFGLFGNRCGRDALSSLREAKPFNLVKMYEFLTRQTNGTYQANWLNSDGMVCAEPRTLKFNPYAPAVMQRVDRENWGRGLGHAARADAQGVTKLMEFQLMAIGKDLVPPLMIEHESWGHLNADPGGTITIKHSNFGFRPEYLRSGSDHSAALVMAEEIRNRIREAFLGGVIEEPTTQTRSAEAERARNRRELQRVAPVAALVVQQIVIPAMDRHIQIMKRKKALPELEQVEEALQGQAEIKPRIISPFFGALKASTVDPVQNLVDQLQTWAANGQDPEWTDLLDKESVIKLIVDRSDIDRSIIASNAEVEILRSRRTAQSIRQQQNEAAQNFGRLGDASPIPTI